MQGASADAEAPFCIDKNGKAVYDDCLKKFLTRREEFATAARLYSAWQRGEAKKQ